MNTPLFMESYPTPSNDKLMLIKEDLEYWRKKKEHFEKKGDKRGVNVSNLLLDRYLDKYNNCVA